MGPEPRHPVRWLGCSWPGGPGAEPEDPETRERGAALGRLCLRGRRGPGPWIPTPAGGKPGWDAVGRARGCGDRDPGPAKGAVGVSVCSLGTQEFGALPQHLTRARPPRDPLPQPAAHPCREASPGCPSIGGPLPLTVNY